MGDCKASWRAGSVRMFALPRQVTKPTVEEAIEFVTHIEQTLQVIRCGLQEECGALLDEYCKAKIHVFWR